MTSIRIKLSEMLRLLSYIYTNVHDGMTLNMPICILYKQAIKEVTAESYL